MCDRARWLALGAAWCLTATPGAAQGAAEMREEALAARSRFVRAAQHAIAARATLDSLVEDRRRTSTRDTVRAGPIAIRVVGDEMTAAERAALGDAVRGAWDVIRAYRDTLLDAAVSGEPLEVAAYPTSYTGPLGRRRFRLYIPKPAGRTRDLGPSLDPASVRGDILHLYGSTVGARLPKRLAAWLGEPWVRLAPPTPEDWQDARVDLATSRSSVARGCLSDAAACGRALEADGTPPGDPLRAWYTASDVEALVAEWTPRDSAGRVLREACVEKAVQEACEAAARNFNLPHPVPNALHQLVLQSALHRGGADALARAVAAGGAVPAALEDAAGAPLAGILEGWRDSVLAAPLPRTLPGPGEAAMILLWTAGFGALALRRRP